MTPSFFSLSRTFLLIAETVEVYEYLDEDIFMMTDEEENKDTLQWPSQANIVSSRYAWDWPPPTHWARYPATGDR
jgi:hypothetical protein